MKGNAVETIIGGAVIVIAVAFFTYVYQTADLRAGGADGYTVTARFENVNGITRGSDIRMAGIKIGTVAGHQLDPDTYEAVLTLEFDPYVKLPIDSSAKITADGLLGDNYIAIDPGGDPTMLADGGVIDYTQGALDLFGLIGSFLFSDSGEEQSQ